MSMMWWDLSLQALMFIVSIGMYLWMNNDLPRRLITRYHSYRNRDKHQSRRHFVKAAELLSKARSFPKSSPQSLSFASSAASEADSAVKLDPTDAANHIIRALALDLQGYKPSALDSINTAFSPLAVGSLSAEEKADALVKRAELRMEVSRLGKGDESDFVDESVWNVLEGELREAVALRKDSGRAWCLLGEVCEGLGKTDLAKQAFEEVTKLEPGSSTAAAAKQRLAAGKRVMSKLV